MKVQKIERSYNYVCKAADTKPEGILGETLFISDRGTSLICDGVDWVPLLDYVGGLDANKPLNPLDMDKFLAVDTKTWYVAFGGAWYPQ